MGYSPWQAQCSDHTLRTEPGLGGSPIQPGRYVRIHLNAADGGHRGADADTDYVGPQEGEVLIACSSCSLIIRARQPRPSPIWYGERTCMQRSTKEYCKICAEDVATTEIAQWLGTQSNEA